MKKIYITFTLLAFFGCSNEQQSSSHSKIINGSESSSYPAVVSFMYVGSDGLPASCTGAFIKRNLILTAAHCVNDVDESQISVRNFTGIRPIKIHRNYDFSTNNPSHDIAILEFSRPLFTGTTLTFSNTKVSSIRGNVSVTLIGYGHNQYQVQGGRAVPSPHSKPGVKREGTAIFSPAARIAGGSIRLSDARGQYAAGAKGDSGSPLIYQGRIIGVAHSSGFQVSGGTIIGGSTTYADITSSQSCNYLLNTGLFSANELKFCN